MSMPGDTAFGSGLSFWGANLTLAVINGTVPEWRLDDMATRIVAAWYKVGRDQTQIPINFDAWTLDTYGNEHDLVGLGYEQVNEHVNVQDDHASLVRNIASRGTVLLKNENNALPLKRPRFVAVIGNDAGDNPDGPNACADRGCDSGTLAQGWGSGTANYPYLVSPASAIQSQGQADGSTVKTVTDNFANSNISLIASQASVALVFVSADSGEGYIEVDGNLGKSSSLGRPGPTILMTDR